MTQGGRTYTLITGASMGIGRALAEECANRGHHLLLVALPDNGLEVLAAELKEKHPVSVHVLGLDMLAPGAPAEIFRWCCENAYPVNLLVNNIGVGGRSNFERCSTEELDQMLILNIRSATLLSQLFVALLRQHSRSCILNVGSAAGFFHVPYKAVYSATKAYLYSLTRSLRSELKPLGIHVALLAPGGASNRSDPVVHQKVNGWLHRNVHHTTGYIARVALDGALKRKKVIIPGILPKIYIRLSGAFPPSLVDAIVRKLFRNKV